MDRYNDVEINKPFYLSKNHSNKGFHQKGKISINDIDYYSKKIRINSPHSLTAMNKLGINAQELEYLTFKEYLQKYPALIGQDKEIQRVKYNYEEELRKRRFEQIKLLRVELLNEDEAVRLKPRCFSSKDRGLREQNICISLNGINDKRITNTFLEKDIKYFVRMRNINKAELFNRMNVDLKKELLKIINDEREKKVNEDNIRNQKKMDRMIQSEKNRKLKLEEEKLKKEKENDYLERKKEEQRIQKLIEKSINDEKLYKQKIKEERLRRDAHEKSQNEFKQKMNLERETKYLLLLEKENQQEKEENERYKKEKKMKEEQRLKKEMKKDLLRKLKEKRELTTIQKFDDYNLTRNQNSNTNYFFITSKEIGDEKSQKHRDIISKSELLFNIKKENIINRINEKEKAIQRLKEEKKRQNFLAQEEQIQKEISKEHRVKQISQLLENRNNEIREQLNEKDKRIEEFMQNKTKLVKKKKFIYDEINKEKEFDNEQFNKIMSKKCINSEILHSLKDMFPDNRQFDVIISEFNEHLSKDKDKSQNYK